MQQQHTILVIDDDYEIQWFLNDILSEAGYSVVMTDNGTAGYHSAQLTRPNLILLDIDMPGIDGYETYRLLRKNPRTKKIPIFFLTGMHGRLAGIKGARLGIDDYLAKPVDYKVLMVKIKYRLAASRYDLLRAHLYGSV